MSNFSHGSIARVFLWVYSAPVLSCWVLLSFVPVVGVLIEDASLLSIIGDAIFFVFGFVGLCTGYILAIFFAQPELKARMSGSLRGRVGLVSAYATVWLVAYWLFKFFIV